MAINSNIKSTVSLTLTKPEPDGVIFREIFRGTQPDKLWSGNEQTFFVIPSNQGCPVYFSEVTPTITTDSLIESVSTQSIDTYNYKNGCFKGCDSIPSGVTKVVIKPILEGGVKEDVLDKCLDCVVEKLIPQKEDTSITIDYNGISQSFTVSVCSDEEPICLKTTGDINHFYEELIFLDCKNDRGDSIHFGNQGSKLSRVLGRIFEGSIFSDISSKVNNFDENLVSLTTSDPSSINSKLSIMGCDTDDDLETLPTEISNILQISSIDYNTLFGKNCKSKDDSSGLSSQDLLKETDLVKVGERLWYQDFADPNGEIKCLVVPPKGVSSVLTFDDLSDGDLNYEESYPLSEMEAECVDTKSCFWRKEVVVENQSFLETNCIHKIPSESEWIGLCEDRIQYELLGKLS